jgi:hypothetical protein
MTMTTNPFRNQPDDDQLTAAQLFELAGQVDRLRRTAAWLEGNVEAPPEARSVAAALREVLHMGIDLGHAAVLGAAVTGYGETFSRHCDEAAQQAEADQQQEVEADDEQGGGGS